MAVKKIFSKKYSNGRGKLVDAMKDPETKIVHAELLGKKPSKSMTKGKTMKNKKMGGQTEPASQTPVPQKPEPDPEPEPELELEPELDPESELDTNADQPGGKQKSTRGGKKSKKSKKNSSKKGRSKSFRKKPKCMW